MSYNLTAIYSGGPIEQFNALNIASNFILLDGLMICTAIIMIMVLTTRSTNTKQSVFTATGLMAIISLLASFALSTVDGITSAQIISYTTRTLFWFALATLSLLWNVL